MNSAIQLAAAMFLRKHGRVMPKNDVLEVVLAVVDNYNEQHWHDRNRHDERIKKLEQASDPS